MHLTLFSITICQKFSTEFGFGAVVAMNFCLISLNVIMEALMKFVAGCPEKLLYYMNFKLL